MIETVISGLTDEFPILGRGSFKIPLPKTTKRLKIPKKIALIGGMCFFMFLIGLPMTTNVSGRHNNRVVIFVN